LAPKPSGKEPSPRMVLMAPRYELNQPSNAYAGKVVYQLQLFGSRTSCNCLLAEPAGGDDPEPRVVVALGDSFEPVLSQVIESSAIANIRVAFVSQVSSVHHFFSPNVSILRTLLYLIFAALTQLRNFDEQDNVPNTIVGAAHGHVHEPLRTYGLLMVCSVVVK
jgi:hypothetical protein